MAVAEAPPDACIQKVMEAGTAENEAIELDRQGQTAEALRRYEDCERALGAAIAAASPLHVDDKPKLEEHREQVRTRIAHLRSVGNGPATIPVEQQIQAVQLSMRVADRGSQVVAAGGGAKTLAAVAAMGAVGGFVVLGGTIGSSLAIVGGAAGGVFLASRQDGLGDAARKAGRTAVAGVDKARAIDREHGISDKAKDLGIKAVCKGKEVNEKYGITDKVGSAAGAAASRAKAFEEKHQVSSKVAGGIAAGLTKASALIGGKKDAPGGGASGSRAPAGGGSSS